MATFTNNIFNVADIVADVAKKDPTRIAIIEPDGYDSHGKRKYRRYTYARLSEDAESIVEGLRKMGIHEGTRIVSMTPPTYETCVFALALQRIGAVALMIDPTVGYFNVAERLNRIKPEAFIGTPLAHLGRSVFGWGARFPKKSIVINGFFPGAKTLASLKGQVPKVLSQPNVTPDDPAVILYTTGSTGPAKPTLYLQRNYSELYRVVHKSWRFTPNQEPPVDMAIFPAFFLIALTAGGTMVVPPINFPEPPGKTKPQSLLEVINDCKVQTCFASPVILENMARYAVEHKIKTPSLKRIIGGGAPIYKRVNKALLEMMGDQGEVFSNYGATEAMPSTEMSGKEALEETFPLTDQGHGVCVGRPFEGVELRIVALQDGAVDSIDKTTEMPKGKIGEILVRGKHISLSYFMEPESTRKNKIPDPSGQWHRLGDAGYIDEKERLWVCGRVSQRVKAKEGPLFSLLAEPIFDTHPLVHKSGLAGVPKGNTEVPVICVELVPNINKNQHDKIRKELLELAGRYESTNRIKHILFIDKLPVDPRHNSKIERPKLVQWASDKI